MVKNLNVFNLLLPKKSLPLFLILLFLLNLPLLNCAVCTTSSKIIEGDACFNGIIRNGGRSGQFSLRHDGVLLIEFSEGNKRIFYGYKPNGRGVFQNDSNINVIEITKAYKNNNQDTIDSRYESKNILISLTSDLPQDNQYIFSISAYYALAELHFFDENYDNSHKTWTSTNFLNVGETRVIFSYQFSLIEGSGNTYYAAFIQYKGTYNNGGEAKDYSDSYALSKFSFSSLNERTILTKEFYGNFDNRIICAFIFDHFNALAVIYLKTNYYYTIRLHKLDTLDEEKSERSFYKISAYSEETAFKGEGIFFKALYLTYEYFAFVFFEEKDKPKSLKFIVFKIENYDSNYFETRNKYEFNEEYNDYHNFDTSIRLSEFYKIDNETFLFVSSYWKTKIYIIFFDTYNWYNYMNVRLYKFDMKDYYLREELSVGYYNDFLMLANGKCF